MPDALKVNGTQRPHLTPDAIRVWAGRGTGKPCELCRKAIPAEEFQYDLEVTEELVAVTNALRGRILSFHLNCYDHWRANLLTHGTHE